MILLDELDNAYGDVYSAAVSTHGEANGWSVRRWGVTVALACTALALVLPMHSLEPFLLMLSSVFVPLYGVILGRLGCNCGEHAPFAGRIQWSAAVIWLVGIAVFHACAQWTPQYGSAIPSLLLTYALAWWTRPRPSASDASTSNA